MGKLLELLEKLARAIFGPGDELRQPVSYTHLTLPTKA